MKTENETVADIVREMRDYRNGACGYWMESLSVDRFDSWLDRIEAARETGDCDDCLHKHPQCADCSKLAAEECERNDLLVENERLRRALKPVLECHLCDGGQQVVSDALCAIREAKEIMKGEAK